MNQARLSHDARAKIVSGLHKRKLYRTIAAEVRCSVATVGLVAIAEGLERGRGPGKKRGPKKRSGLPRLRFTAEQKAAAVDRVRNGESCASVARDLNITHVAVSKWCRAAGLRQRERLPRTRMVAGEIEYRCYRCGKYRPKDAFWPNRAKSRGISDECRRCRRERRRRSRRGGEG